MLITLFVSSVLFLVYFLKLQPVHGFEIFFHSSLKHVFYNVLGLLYFGMLAEHKLGRKWYILFLTASSLFSQLFSMAVYRNFLGFSGVVYSLIGFVAVVMPFAPTIGFGAPFPAFFSAILYALIDILGVGENVAHWSHLSGLFLGLIAGTIWRLINMEPSAGEMESGELPHPGEPGEDSPFEDSP